MRVFTEIGNPREPSLAARITSRASAGFFIIAAPAPCFSTDLSGQPMFISMPSKPRSLHNAAAPFLFSGRPPKIWATIGRSASLYFKSIKSFSRALGWAKPSAETNSVKKSGGLPYLAFICLKAQSVTSAIGASANMGFFSYLGVIFARLENYLRLFFLGYRRQKHFSVRAVVVERHGLKADSRDILLKIYQFFEIIFQKIRIYRIGRGFAVKAKVHFSGKIWGLVKNIAFLVQEIARERIGGRLRAAPGIARFPF